MTPLPYHVVEGADHTGAVLVVLGADGLPASIEVRTDWEHRLAADAFGAAVLKACNAATLVRIAPWSKPPVELGAGWRPVAPFPVRPVAAIVEEVLRAADDLARAGVLPPAMPMGTGTDASGTLTLTLSEAGLESCTASARWLAGQRADLLTDALEQALAGARVDLDARVRTAAPAADEAPQTPHALLDELFAAVADPEGTTA